jgi:hypothetical protein
MGNRELHKAIRRKFRARGRGNNFLVPTRGTRETLAELFCDLGFNKGAEIGVRRGGYSMLLCQKNPSLELACIDPWAPYGGWTKERQDKIYRYAVRRLSKYNTKIIKKMSMDALSDFENKTLDFVYIDGNHGFNYCCPDIIFWAQKVKEGGIIACHDYYPFRGGGVVRAVDSYTYCNHILALYTTKEWGRGGAPTVFWINP